MADSKLTIHISAPFALDDLLAEIDHDGGKTTVRLVHGRFDGTVPGRPLKLRLLDALPPDAAAPPLPEETPPPEAQPAGRPVEIDQLFDEQGGVEIPADGRLDVQIVWGTPCHQVIQLPEGRRFGSFEHQMCAETVGKAENLEDPFRVAGRDIPLNSETPLPLGPNALRFGDIIALAGDFYAHLDDNAARKFPWAWPRLEGFAGWLVGDYREPPLASAAAAEATGLLDIIERDKDAEHGLAGELCILIEYSVKGEYSARRYLALASQNFCHFGSQPPDGRIDDDRNAALKLYREYHRRALAEAAAAGDDEQALLRAFATDAFGCHFLTDLFASGHMRVPRRELGEQGGILRGALWRAHRMHKEDNQLGLWVAARGTVTAERRLIWRAYGDGMLRTDEAQTHKKQVQEAVRRSAAEVFAASLGEKMAPEQAAEWLIPFPLRAGEGPRASDQVLPDADPNTVNHYPMYWLLPNGYIARRVGGPSESTYRYKVALGDERDLDFGSDP